MANCALTQERRPLAAYFASLVTEMDAGWTVAFGEEPALGLLNQTVAVPRSRLVIGLANGWTATGRMALFIDPSALGAAWRATQPSLRPRGFMFWDIGDEGRGDPPLRLARGLNAFLHTRRSGAAVPSSTSQASPIHPSS